MLCKRVVRARDGVVKSPAQHWGHCGSSGGAADEFENIITYLKGHCQGPVSLESDTWEDCSSP